MRDIKFYGLNDYLDFGDYKGEQISKVLIKNRNRIDYYLRTVDWFLMKEDLILAFGAKFPDTLIPNKDSLTGDSMKYTDYLTVFNEKKKNIFYKKHPDILTEKRGLWLPEDKNSKADLSSLNRDAFSDGDGTEEWSFYNE